MDRKVLAGLLLEIAHDLRPELRAERNGIHASDLRLEQLRTLLVGREIEVLSRLQDVLEDPEKLAAAVGRVLPTAIAEATADPRLGQVLAPAMEKATERSIRNNPRTLVDILYPVIVPTIGKSIRETIAATFQSLNQTLKYSLTWRGLKWRWEAWRTGVSFAEVVLKHSLVYQVEHVFLIHGHTGLLICHAAAENAASQDPQLVSSMLVAIQDFVRDSFGAEKQGLDAARLGELRLWCEPGPFAMLVAVIRGDPPEQLYETLRHALSRIHAERHQALESFDGDSDGFAEVEAELRQCVALRQPAPPRANFSRVMIVAWLAVVLMLAGAFISRSWDRDRLWQTYIAQLQAEPGIVVTEAGRRDGKYVVSGLRDPLAPDPQMVLRQIGIDSQSVISRWAPYEAMQPQFVLARLQASLDPPPTVGLALEGDRIVAHGSASTAWLERAREAARMLPTGALVFDVSQLHDTEEAGARLWAGYVRWLRAEPGVVITETGRRDGKYFITGLRDPLAVDPELLLSEAKVDPAQVVSRWSPYQALDPQFVLKRLQASLDLPPTVTLRVDDGRIVAEGSASPRWLERARLAGRMLPSGPSVLDLSAVRDLYEGAIGDLRDKIQARSIHFDAGGSLPGAGQDAVLDAQAEDIKQVASLSSSMGVSTRVTLIGHADSAGQGTSNLSLSVARAEVVRALLKKRGVNPDLLAVRGAGALEPLQEETSDAARSANRRVSFSLGIDE
ncbi:OmpA family protein [Mesorhizobium sp. B1-1-8]|uniref:OmpA family protein n=1 Tax=Mesorhizobium sp. B1-1-8 TaxID=2589976 RepID=UPI00112DE7EA|nr:OmpA family protein [Mesorhizobium sp. B1-1-8]UCI08762.1 OmpA family protein [Mesorhizobium sp. B1-1-8]